MKKRMNTYLENKMLKNQKDSISCRGIKPGDLVLYLFDGRLKYGRVEKVSVTDDLDNNRLFEEFKIDGMSPIMDYEVFVNTEELLLYLEDIKEER